MALSKELLKQVILDQNQALRRKLRSYVHRALQDTIVSQGLNNDFIVVIKGPRRAGKSTLMAYLKDKHLNADFYINFDDDRLLGFDAADFQTLLEAFIEMYGPQKHIFLDEVQNVQGWELFVSRLHNAGYKVFVTGSNSRLLSREYGTHLTGRHISFTLFPFSYTEFVRYKISKMYDVLTNVLATAHVNHVFTTKQRAILLRLFDEYVKYGGFPEYVKTKNDIFLTHLYESVIYKDIVARYNIKDEHKLRLLAKIAASNIGHVISFRSFKSIGISSTDTVSRYFHYLNQAYMFFLVPKFSCSYRASMQSNKKVYMIDTALARLVGARATEERGKMLENVVFVHLYKASLDANVDIYYYRNKYECDFVLQKDTNKPHMLVQVTEELNEDNKQREINGILNTAKHLELEDFQAVVVTRSQKDCINTNGVRIQVLPVYEFLAKSPA